jgi:pyruvate dehydrogenase E2 component (dihydrolipoamide acetyltransferase)
MGSDSDAVMEVRMPQVNVNDTEVRLIGWHVEDGVHVAEGEPLCEVETSKSVGDVPAPASGFLRRLIAVGEYVEVGAVFALLGASAEDVMGDRTIANVASSDPHNLAGNAPVLPAATETASIGEEAARPPSADLRTAACSEVPATAGAVELARRHGIDLSRVPGNGRIRRADVEAYVRQGGVSEIAGSDGKPASSPVPLPPALAGQVTDAGELSAHQWSVARHLASTQAGLITAHAAMDVCVEAARTWIDSRRKAGRMVGMLPVLLHAAGQALQENSRPLRFRIQRQVYQYRAVNLAYTARSHDGRLFTPVVRHVDQLTLDEVADRCAALNMAVFRGTVPAEDLAGGCMTLSLLDAQPMRFHVGLQNAFQSAVLTAGAVREELALSPDGRQIIRPVTTLVLSYDHGLMDGWDAAEWLNSVKAAIESPQV